MQSGSLCTMASLVCECNWPRQSQRTWRPPWLLTTMPSTPARSASTASAGASTPCASTYPLLHKACISSSRKLGTPRACRPIHAVATDTAQEWPAACRLTVGASVARGNSTPHMALGPRLDEERQPRDRAQPPHECPGQAGINIFLKRARERAAAQRRAHPRVGRQADQVGSDSPSGSSNLRRAGAQCSMC